MFVNVIFMFLLMATMGQLKNELDLQKKVTMMLAREIDTALGKQAGHINSIADFLVKAFDVKPDSTDLKN